MRGAGSVACHAIADTVRDPNGPIGTWIMPAENEIQIDDCCLVFAESYEVSNLPAMRAIERSVLGCDYGGTSWTTIDQAAQIIDLLDLQPGRHVLDIGAGSGWPGLYLADSSGCDVTLLDLPLNALGKARQRACDDGIESRVNAVVASGAAMPFKDACFDSVSHSDVLCCLPEKTGMLMECRRVAGNAAKMLFSVIAIPMDLSGEQRQRAIDSGPPFVAAENDYAEMLEECGWNLLQRIDATAEYRESLCTLVAALDNDEALSDALGSDAIRVARIHRQEQIAVIDAGYLVREIFSTVAS